MKILYIGDNRDVPNWGCRSTSKALLELISKNNEIVYAIGRKECHNPVPIVFKKISIFQNAILKALSYTRYNSLIQKYKLKFETSDFVSEDINLSLNIFLKEKDNNNYLDTLYKKLRSVDAIVINGEGSFILSNPPRRDTLFFLFLIKTAFYLQKKIYILNSMFSPCSKTGTNISLLNSIIYYFNLCDKITLRDKLSYDFISNYYQNENIKYIPDALFTWYDYFKNEIQFPLNSNYIIPFPDKNIYWNTINFSDPYIILSGSSRAAWTPKESTPVYISLAEKLKKIGLNIVIVPTCGGDMFLYDVAKETKLPIIPLHTPIISGASILAGAKVMVSGRFHPSIMASLGGTPCVFLGSNSHKNTALQDLLEYENIVEYSALPTEEEQDVIIDILKIYIKNNKEIRNKILSRVDRLSKEAREVEKLL